MKYLLLLFSFQILNSQILQDPGLEGIFTDFIDEGKERGYDYTSKIYDNLVSIEYSDLVYPKLGQYTHYNKTIRVSPFLQIDTLVLKLVVFHELGHLIKETSYHSCFNCTDLMSERSGKNYFYYYRKEENYEKELDKLFKWLDGKQLY